MFRLQRVKLIDCVQGRIAYEDGYDWSLQKNVEGRVSVLFEGGVKTFSWLYERLVKNTDNPLEIRSRNFWKPLIELHEALISRDYTWFIARAGIIYFGAQLFVDFHYYSFHILSAIECIYEYMISKINIDHFPGRDEPVLSVMCFLSRRY